MAAHARLKNEFTEDEKCQNLMSWLIQYFLDNDFIEPSQSDGSSPCILVSNLMGHFVCVQTIVKLILSLKQAHFPSHELMIVLITMEMQNVLPNLIF